MRDVEVTFPNFFQNLPLSHADKTEEEAFKIFVSSLFYIGKGSRSDRPFNHLREARKKVSQYKLCSNNPRCFKEKTSVARKVEQRVDKF